MWKNSILCFVLEASLKADTAYNYEKKGLWKFVGNVKVESLEGKTFETSLLFYDEKKRKRSIPINTSGYKKKIRS